VFALVLELVIRACVITHRRCSATFRPPTESGSTFNDGKKIHCNYREIRARYYRITDNHRSPTCSLFSYPSRDGRQVELARYDAFALSLSLSLKLKRNNVIGHNYAHFPVTQRRDFPRDVVALGLLSFRCLMRRFRSARFVSGAPRLYQRDRRESR